MKESILPKKNPSTFKHISPNIKGQVLYTLPNEVTEKQLDFDEDSHTQSVSIEYNKLAVANCTSPTFATDMSSVHSYNYRDNKQNRGSLVNKTQRSESLSKITSGTNNSQKNDKQLLLDAQLLKGANNKLVERNMELEEENKKLKQMLKNAEELIEAKFLQMGYHKFLQAYNQAGKSNVNILLEMMCLKNIIIEQTGKLTSGQNKLKEAYERIRENEIAQEKKELEFNEEVKKFSNAIQKLTKKNELLKEQKNKLTNPQTEKKLKEIEKQYNETKILSDEIEKQRQQLAKKSKQLQEEIRIKNLKLDELHNQYDKMLRQYQSVNLENQKNKELIRKQERRLESVLKQKEKCVHQYQKQKQDHQYTKKQLQLLQTKSHALSMQINKLTNELKIQKHESELKQYDSRREKSEELKSQIEKLRRQINEEKNENENLQQRISQIQETNNKLHQQINELSEEQRKSYQQYQSSLDKVQNAKNQIEMDLNMKNSSMSELKKNYQMLEMEFNEFRKQKQSEFLRMSKNMSESIINQSRLYSTKAEPRLSTKLRDILKTLRDSLPKYDSIRNKRYQSEDESESYANQISVLVNSLILMEQKVKKENELLREKLDSYDKERTSIVEDKTLEIGLKEEVIRRLIAFIPQDLRESIEEYLYVIEQLTENYSNEYIDKKAELTTQLNEEAAEFKSKLRHYQEIQKKYTEIKAEHEHLKRLLSVNQTRRNEMAEINKREVLKKYFN